LARELEIPTPEWARPLLAPSRYKGAWGGRGSGKSHFFAELLVEEHIANPNQSSVCIREIQRTLNQSVKRLIESKIQSLQASSLFEVQDRIIKNRRGNGIIIFEGMQNHNSDSIKSLEGFDRAFVEEAQNLSQRSLDLLRPTIRKPKSELWFAWNPGESTDPIDQFLRGSESPPDAIVVPVNFDKNPWFPDVLRAEMEYDKRTNPDKYAHIWLGQYMQSSERRVFKNWKVEEFDTPDNAIFYLGADWGFAQDPSVLIRCYLVGRNLYVDYEAYQVGCEVVDTPALFMSVPDSEKWPITADSARPETISHMRKHGFPKIYPAVKGKGSIEDGIEFLKSYQIIAHPRCVHLTDELSLYKYKEDALTGRILPILEDKDNHCIDALRYALEGARRAAKTKPVQDVAPLPTVNRW
jgi:phage terminase large subunit